jgi:hypothetical protein
MIFVEFSLYLKGEHNPDLCTLNQSLIENRDFRIVEGRPIVFFIVMEGDISKSALL